MPGQLTGITFAVGIALGAGSATAEPSSREGGDVGAFLDPELVAATRSSAPVRPSLLSDTEQRAKELYQKAAELETAGNYAEAIEYYRSAYDAADRPAILLSVAAVHYHEGELAAAANVYQEYLDHGEADLVQVPRVQQVQRAIDRKVARVTIRARTEGIIAIDTHFVGNGPTEVVYRLTPGKHSVSISKETAGTQTQSFEIEAGDNRSVDILAAPNLRRPERPERALVSRPSFWLAAGSAAILSTGVAFTASAQSAHNEFRNALFAGSDRNTLERLDRKADSRALGAKIAFGLSAGTALTALILYKIEERQDEQMRVAVEPTSGGAVIGISGKL